MTKEKDPQPSRSGDHPLSDKDFLPLYNRAPADAQALVRMILYFSALNSCGKQRAAEFVEDLAHVPRYQSPMAPIL